MVPYLLNLFCSSILLAQALNNILVSVILWPMYPKYYMRLFHNANLIFEYFFKFSKIDFNNKNKHN